MPGALAGVLAALLGALPAQAAEPLTATVPRKAETSASPCPAAFTASAASDLVVLRTLDLRPLAVPGIPTTALVIGPTRAGLYGGSRPLTAARAGALRTLADQDDAVYQIAPPTADDAVSRKLPAVGTGLLRIGTRSLTARAAMRDRRACETAGVTAKASATLLDDSVFGGRDGRALIVFPGGSSSTTTTGLLTGGDGYTVTATAASTLTELRLFAGSPAETAVRLLTQPKLLVTAGGKPDTSTVRYSVPTLALTAAGREVTLRKAGDLLDLIVPVDADSVAAARKLARDREAPLLPATTLTGLLSDLGGSPEPPSDPSTPDSLARVVVIRLSVGTARRLDVGLDGSAVHALAAALRLQVLLHSTQGERTTEAPLVDMSMGYLEALATAPPAPTPDQAPADSTKTGPSGRDAKAPPRDPADSDGQSATGDATAVDWVLSGVASDALAATTDTRAAARLAVGADEAGSGTITGNQRTGGVREGSQADRARGGTGPPGPPGGYRVVAVLLLTATMVVAVIRLSSWRPGG